MCLDKAWQFMDKPLISIIVPVYNVEHWVKECIDSVINQSYKNFELIIVNDGSTDNSLNICTELAVKDSKVHVYNKENGGLSSARNFGIKKANGDYLFFLDGDDYLAVNALNMMMSIPSAERYDIILGTITKNDVFLRNYEAGALTRAECLSNILLQKLGLTHSASAKLYRRELFNDVCFPVGRLYEDEFTIYKVISKAERIYYTGVCVYHYRYREGSILTSPEKIAQRCVDLYDASNNLNEVIPDIPELYKPLIYRQTMDNIGIVDMIGDKHNRVLDKIKKKSKSIIRKHFGTMLLYHEMSFRSKVHMMVNML